MQVNKMIATIQVYIFHMTDRAVVIKPVLPKEYGLLLKAYDIAYEWSKNNLITSKIIL